MGRAAAYSCVEHNGLPVDLHAILFKAAPCLARQYQHKCVSGLHLLPSYTALCSDACSFRSGKIWVVPKYLYMIFRTIQRLARSETLTGSTAESHSWEASALNTQKIAVTCQLTCNEDNVFWPYLVMSDCSSVSQTCSRMLTLLLKAWQSAAVTPGTTVASGQIWAILPLQN